MNVTRRVIFGASLVILFIIILFIQKNNDSEQLVTQLSGRTMGTSYNIKYLGSWHPQLQQKVDSLLEQFNLSLSTYIPDSEISQFNNGRDIAPALPFFMPVLQKSEEIFHLSDGGFDPTVMPLVQAWGFGPSRRETMDSAKVDSLLQYVGFQHISYSDDSVHHLKAGVKLDFSALAKGYGVDVIAEYLERYQIQDYMVEIGGEVRCRGLNDRGNHWTIGIEDPTIEDSRELIRTVELDNRSLATSGNYRNYYELDGVRYAHTISPFSGYPVEHTLLSASVFTPDCMTADALATAFMVLGKEKAISIINTHQDWDAFFIYFENDSLQTYATEGIRSKLNMY